MIMTVLACACVRLGGGGWGMGSGDCSRGTAMPQCLSAPENDEEKER